MSVMHALRAAGLTFGTALLGGTSCGAPADEDRPGAGTAARGDQPRRRGSAIVCAPPGDSVVAGAVRQYVTALQPRPRRFLVMLGSDSTLPDAGRQALQERGPTYLYPADPAGQAAVRSKLTSEYGALRTVLVLYGGMRRPDDQSTVVRLAGRVVGGSDDGQRTPSVSMHFSCETAQWRFSNMVEDAA